MAQIHNTETIKRILDDGGIQTSTEDVPTQLASKVVPVLVSNPPIVANVLESAMRNTTGSVTVYTTPTDKDFFLTSAYLGFVCDATCDGTLYFLKVSPKGQASTSLISIRKATTTADRDFQPFAFPIPLQLEKGTNITVTCTFTAGTTSFDGGIVGYTRIAPDK